MKNFIKSFLILIFIITANCGFKIVDRSQLDQIKILEIEKSGDKKINFLIRNKINNILRTENSNNRLNINLKTQKTKSVKEKNSKNQITKYNIKIDTVVNLNFIDKNLIETYTITKEGYYEIAENHNTTINNLKKLEKNLSDQISQEIIDKIVRIVNEF